MHARHAIASCLLLLLVHFATSQPEEREIARKKFELGGFVRVTLSKRIEGGNNDDRESTDPSTTTSMRAMYFVNGESTNSKDNNDDNVPMQTVVSCEQCPKLEPIIIDECCAQVEKMFFPYQRAIIAGLSSMMMQQHTLDLPVPPSQLVSRTTQLRSSQRFSKMMVQKRFLIFGLGGGAIPMFLRTKFPNAKVECVEISSVVIQLARKFFGLARVENRNNNVAYGSGSLRIIHDDGRHYISKEIQQGRAGWDAIILDAYAHGLPSMLRTTNFFQLLQKSVSSQGGVIISNLDVSGTNGQMNNKVSRLLQGYSVVFGHENMSELDLGASKVVLVLVDGVDGVSDKEKEKKKKKKKKVTEPGEDITMKIITLVDRCNRVAQAHDFSSLDICQLIQRRYTQCLCFNQSAIAYRDNDDDENINGAINGIIGNPTKHNEQDDDEACHLKRLVERRVISPEEFAMMSSMIK